MKKRWICLALALAGTTLIIFGCGTLCPERTGDANCTARYRADGERGSIGSSNRERVR